MEPQAPFNHPPPATARPDALRSLVHRALRQPGATSDTLLILADWLSEMDHSARALAEALRTLAPAYPSSVRPPLPTDPARALIRQHPVRAARLRQLVQDMPCTLENAELTLLSALARAADLEEGHSP